MDKQDIIKLFLDEAVEHLEVVSNQLMLLENDPTNEEIIQVLFRSAHTLKGNSTTAYNTLLDFDADERILIHIKNIGRITHSFENLIMEVRDNGFLLTNEHIELLFEVETIVETLLTYVEQNITEELNVEDLYDRVQLSLSVTPTVEVIKPIYVPTEKNTFEITLAFENEHEENSKHAYLSMVYVDIRDKYEPNEEGELLTFYPNFDELMEGQPFEAVYFQLSNQFDVDEVIQFVSTLNNVASVTLSTLPIAAPDDIITEAPVSEPEVPVVLEHIEKINQQVAKKNTPVVQKNLISNTNIRVDIKRIDEVLKHVSSLVISKNKLSTYASILTTEEVKFLKDVSEEISQTVDFLQDSVMKIRMTPLEQLFQRFPKDVRNIAKEYNKKVQFEHRGGATEIDKSLLDNLGNPLIHLIRNSLFHGLESEEERIEAGKDPVGKLTLSANHEQGEAIIVIEDDGRGIDIEKVVAKAIEKGYITEEKAKTLKEDEAVQLIFASGLSTAEKVTNVAGRGVGMDAVKAVIEDEMRGTVHVQSVLGHGTKTTIRLPITLAIINAMRTKINDLDFAFPINQVEEVIAIQPKEIKYVANKEIYIHREKEIPIIRLNEYFNMESSYEDGKMINLVVLKLGEKTIAVTVDEFVIQEDIVVKNIGKYLGNVPGISGCTILGDGSMSLIVDANTLIK